MPTADQHRRKAEKNRRLLAALSADDYPEWVATIAFYTALHRVEQLRHAVGDGHSQNHGDRLAYIQTVHPAVRDPFEFLLAASQIARYESAALFFSRYDADIVRDRVIAGWLVAVEAYVESQTAPPEAAP